MTDSVSLHCPNCGAAVGPAAKQCTYCQAALATMSCPNCFNRVFIGSAYCPHCGTRAARQVAADAAPDMCPRCKTAMASVQVGATALTECPACAGVWVDAEAFDRLCGDRAAQAAVIHGNALRSAGPGAAPTEPEKISYRPCPRCRQMMNRVNFARRSGVILDVCRAHGTFFDRDELHRVVAFIQAGGMDRAREKDREELEEAERRLRSLQASGGAVGGFAMMSPYVDDGLDLKTRAALSAFELFVNMLLDWR